MAMKLLASLYIALALAVATPAHAQTAPATVLEPPAPRQGYYISLGIESGMGFIWDKSESQGSRALTGVPMFRFGQLLTTRFSLGLKLGFLGGAKSGVTTSLGGLQIETGYRVWKNLAVNGGIGAGFASLSQKNPPDPDDELRGAYGAFYMLGVSYDFFPYKKKFSGGLAITPTLGARLLPSSPIDAVAVLVGIDFVWWTGLPKNQLDLPPDRAF